MRTLLSALLLWSAVAAAAVSNLTVTPPAVEMIANTAYGGTVTTFDYVSVPPSPGPWTVSILWGAGGPATSGTVTGAGPFTITTDPVTLGGGDILDVTVTVNDT